VKLLSPLRTRVLPVFLGGVSFAACLGAPEARAQDFAIGAGGMIINDIGHETALEQLLRGQAGTFFEGVVTATWCFSQARTSRPGSKDENDVRVPS
jgi:hypothetical protein